ncbi:PH domain-containing protein [Bacillus sp. FJAT-50079]|uniref:PH domain-containing protein n=1 Tax=Bacillus sp. FJAT-50079 TaxID=2833577 RepID=UPI001BCA426E|nr:PH domain-containing protein [Bacillus sp. FJAT-50079]
MNINQPAKRISKKGLKVWRIVGTITSAIIWLLVIGVGVMSFFFEWSFLFVAVAAIVAVIGTIFFVKIIPSLRWKWWRYEVREQEIELQHGIFIITRTLVPMVRVQHVDTVQGPLLRKYRLASIEISTAASRHEIPAVDIEEAEELRYKISKLARVAEEDV